MAVTQKDIAKALNLSQGLVAQVLNNSDSARATDETRQRILQKAQEMDYRPNAAARNLRSGRTRTVMFATVRPPDDNIRNVYAMIVETLAESLSRRDYSLQVRSFSRQAELLRSLEDANSTRSCDIVVLNGSEAEVGEQGSLLERLNLPFAVFGRYEQSHPDWLQVDFDHEGMMDGSVSHLKELGHRRIAYFGHDSAATYAQRLREGFLDSMQRHFGAAPSDELLGWIGEQSPPASEQVRRWIALPEDERPTAAVISTGDRTWMDTELTLAETGRRVGDASGEFSLTGINEEPFPLVLGTAKGYQYLQLDSGALTGLLVESLLMPRLQNKAIENPVQRLLPAMQNIDAHWCDNLRLAVGEFLDRRSS